MKYKNLIFGVALASACFTFHRQLLARQTQDVKPDQPPSQSNEGTDYLRMTRDRTGAPQSLETSITRFRSADGKLLVDLIAVIHVGERDYYRKLDHQFTQYDSLLYELVAPPESRVPDPQATDSSGHPIRWLQGSMQRMLGLESQLKHIDYRQPNFVHADLSPAEMKRKMSDRGDNAWTVALRAMTEFLQRQQRAQGDGTLLPGGEIADLQQLMEMLSNPSQLKTVIATQFTSGSLDMGLGATLNQLLITDRNEAAMKVLRQQIEDGKTRIGIFYGAAHMPDFEKRLTGELELRKTRQAWVQAWNLKSAPGKTSDPAAVLTDMFLQLMDDLDP